MTANGTQTLSYLGTHLRAERRFGGDVRAITPFVDLGLTHVNVGSLFESGAAQLNERVAAYHGVFPTVTSGVRLENSKRFGATMVRGALDFSITQPRQCGYVHDGEPAGAPAGVAPFIVSNTLDRTRFGIAPSLQLTRDNKTSVRIGALYNFSS